MKHLTHIFSYTGILLLIILTTSCEGGKKSGRTDTYCTGEMTLLCDESFTPIMNEEIKVFETIYPEAKVKLVSTNELDCFNELMKQDVHLIITARNFTEKEKKYFESNTIQTRFFPIGYDGLSLIINKENIDSCISETNVKKILSGSATDWSEINKGSKLGTIDVVFDNDKSAAVHYVVDSILDGKPIKSKNITAVKTSEQVINYVEKTKNAVGIIGSNWLNDKRDTTNVTFKKNITVMSVCSSKNDREKDVYHNSRKPYQLYIYNGEYPFPRTIYALLADPYHGLPVGFANFLQSPQGQMIINKSNLLPYRGDLEWRQMNVTDDDEE